MKNPLLPLLACLSAQSAGSVLHAGSLVIPIPQGIEPSSVDADVALYGQGLCPGRTWEMAPNREHLNEPRAKGPARGWG
jgi:hypothetical protein